MKKTGLTIRVRRVIVLVSGFLGLLFFIVFTPRASAATSTLRGIGWWGDLGEVSFNCLDDVMGDRLDDSGNLYNLPEPRGFHFYAEPCKYTSHAVYIDSDNNFSGEAWNATKGFISFSGAQTPPDGGYGSLSPQCMETCNASNDCWACYNEDDQKVYGWARVNTTGEWIRLDSTLTPPVKIQNCNDVSVLPGYSISSGDFIGNASSSLGALSFNCKSETTGDACATRDYKVYISTLSVGNLTAPSWTYTQACASTALGATLRWCKRSGTQTAYEIAITTTDSFSTSTAVCWSGKKYSDFASQYNLPNLDSYCNSLNYNTNYYWWLRLYDENDEPTGWYQYTNNSVTDTDLNIDNNVKTFTTYKHEFPNPFFTWTPEDVLVGTTTEFSALTSRYYTSASPSLPQSCAGPNCRYLWQTDDPGAIFSPGTTTATTSIVFNLATGTTVSVRVMDLDNYYCSTSTILRINYDLPIWREIKAK